jgi:CRISPR-associated protein Cmr2
MSGETALLTFSIGPVHSFIEQARRISDVWAGSYLLSHLTRQAIGEAHRADGYEMIFPFIPKGSPIPNGLPNRFVCRVPADRASAIATAMEERIRGEWDRLVRGAVGVLASYGLQPSPALWFDAPAGERSRQTDRLLDFAWSWVPEEGGYAAASREAARQFAASRMFRPFPSIEENGEKCAVCGERTALPDGDRGKVQALWPEAEQKAEPRHQRFLRADQGRLCLVCATKRFFPLDQQQDARFEAFDEFQPSEDAPYFAVVKMDGDRMGRIFSLPADAVQDGDLEAFHRAVSEALGGFAGGLRTEDSTALLWKDLGIEKLNGLAPQVIYAGGDDVLFLCDPRDALPLARALRNRYVDAFQAARTLLKDPDRQRFTLSAAVLFAHPGHPAGLLLHDLEELLDQGAKERGGRDAVALRLLKRSGAPVEVALPWEARQGDGGTSWIETLDRLTELLRAGRLSSRQTFTLRLEERTLMEVFLDDPARWEPWLTDRLSRNEEVSGEAPEVAKLVAPFFLHRRTPALRIARFLGIEVER